ncbi:MAG: hypothetical protein PHE78_08220, partial [Candidatus Gastranaerophilales bacterium]|nr:hypothetical protein [Candidatus Gastranaerophilales bacterium]
MGFNVVKLLKMTGVASEYTSKLLTPVNGSKAVSLFPCALKQECPFLAKGIGEAPEVLFEALRRRTGLPKTLQSMGKALENGLEPAKARNFISYSEKIEALGKSKIDESVEEIRNILPDHLKGCVGGRGKGQISTLDKLCNDWADKNIVDYDSAVSAVDDLIGTRIVLKDLSQMDTLTDSLATGIKNGDLTITELRNYRGRFNAEYFNDAQISRLSDAVLDRYKSLVAAGESVDGV